MLTAIVQHILKGDWGLGEVLTESQTACEAPSPGKMDGVNYPHFNMAARGRLPEFGG